MSRSEYEPSTAHFTAIRDEFYSPRSTVTKKPENCPVCDLVAEHKQKEIPEALKDYAGVTLRGHEYHISDFVLYRSESMSGPGSIGQIIKFEFPQRETSWDPIVVVVKKLGRASTLKSILPENEIVDEVSSFSIKCSRNMSDYGLISESFSVLKTGKAIKNGFMPLHLSKSAMSQLQKSVHPGSRTGSYILQVTFTFASCFPLSTTIHGKLVNT